MITRNTPPAAPRVPLYKKFCTRFSFAIRAVAVHTDFYSRYQRIKDQR